MMILRDVIEGMKMKIIIKQIIKNKILKLI